MARRNRLHLAVLKGRSPHPDIVGSVKPFKGFTWLLLVLLMLFVAPRAQAGGLKQSVVVSDLNSVPANETSSGTPISIAATTTPNGSTLCATGMVVNVWYTNF